MRTIEKYLTEAKNNDTLEGHIKGAKGWLDNIQKMTDYGNMKDALQTYKSLMKNLKQMEKFLK